MTVTRCTWCTTDPLYQRYHDTEWGIPNKDDYKLFESLILEGFQAGLSWITILKKREAFREAFDGFNPELMARYDQNKVEELMNNAGIIRNRSKIEASINSARAFLELQRNGEPLTDFIWSVTEYKVLKPSQSKVSEPVTVTHEATELSKKLKKAGFKFIGPVTAYAFMQANGLTDDHEPSCFRYQKEV
jgi:DNA-3-methyladenine glycosylase I